MLVLFSDKGVGKGRILFVGMPDCSGPYCDDLFKDSGWKFFYLGSNSIH